MRTTCRACAAGNFEEVLNLGALPLAGGFLENSQAAACERKYPLAVHVCENCGLVQVLDPVDPNILFQDYSFSSSTIQPLVQHFEAYKTWLVNRLHPRTVVEFGCNDGV